MRQYRNRFLLERRPYQTHQKGCNVTKSDACAQKPHRTHAVCIQL